MPNHVINRLEFYCPEEKLKEILAAICYDSDAEAEETGIGTVDFNKITPMPPSLDIESGSNTDRGINLYLTSINPNIQHFGKEKMDLLAFNALMEKIKSHFRYNAYNPSMTSEEIKEGTKYHSAEELIQLGKTAVNNLLQYGSATWYDWRTRMDTWGTKWNSYYPGMYKGDNEINFQTAWSPPHPIIKKLSDMYPEVTIKHLWANEDLWQDCGSRTYLGGEVIDCDYPETDIEQIEASTSIWGSTPEDYGLMMNESGTNYINIDFDTYELVSVCGKLGLFSDSRLTEDDIPKGFHLYHLRSGGSEPYCTLEKNVAVDHSGSIVTGYEINLGESNYITFDENNTLNFLGEELSFCEYMARDLEEREVIDIE